jgi:uncharacterized protein YndB with AHSA1/START domain
LIELRDTVTIAVAPHVLWRWLESMPEHYLEWHPDHLGARWVRGDSVVPGAVIEVSEVLHGKPHRLRMRVTEVQPERLLRYRVRPGLGGAFTLDPVGQGVRFTVTLTIGTRTPVLGSVLDRLLRRLLARRIAAIARHQAEEGAYLKALLEKGARLSP